MIKIHQSTALVIRSQEVKYLLFVQEFLLTTEALSHEDLLVSLSVFMHPWFNPFLVSDCPG